VRIGDTPESLLRRAGQPNNRPEKVWTYCAQGPRDNRPVGFLYPVFTAGGSLELVGTTAPEHEALAVGRGDRITRKFRRGAKRIGSTLLVKTAGKGRRYVYGVRRGRATFVAVTTATVAKDTKRLRATLRSAGLR
jgi:hypothetical protein